MTSLGNDYQLATGEIRLKAIGLNKLLRQLSKAGADAGDMKDLMHTIGMTVVNAARPLAPVKTGKLRASMRAGKGKTKAVIRAGTNKRANYAPIQHFGWKAHNITPKPFYTTALQKTQPQVVKLLSQGIDNIIEKNGIRI